MALVGSVVEWGEGRKTLNLAGWMGVSPFPILQNDGGGSHPGSSHIEGGGSHIGTGQYDSNVEHWRVKTCSPWPGGFGK